MGPLRTVMVAASLERLADLAIESGRLAVARDYVDRALRLSVGVEPAQRVRVLNRLGQLSAATGQLDQAERSLTNARRALERAAATLTELIP